MHSENNDSDLIPRSSSLTYKVLSIFAQCKKPLFPLISVLGTIIIRLFAHWNYQFIWVNDFVWNVWGNKLNTSLKWSLSVVHSIWCFNRLMQNLCRLSIYFHTWSFPTLYLTTWLSTGSRYSCMSKLRWSQGQRELAFTRFQNVLVGMSLAFPFRQNCE